jgi:hypothetical protein
MKQQGGMRPQDIVLLLKIAAKRQRPWLMKDLANELTMSASEVTESLNRSVYAGLLMPDKRKLMNAAFADFLRFGLKYVFPMKPGTLVRGLSTGISAYPLNQLIFSDLKYVWPDAEGEEIGLAIEPLIVSVPKAARLDADFYALIALTETLRFGKAREQEIAIEELKKRL